LNLEGFVDAVRKLRRCAGFTDEERDELDACFEKFDQDMSGNVSSEELMRVFRYMGFNPSEEVFENVVKQVDADGSGEIDQEEFIMAMKIFHQIQRDEFQAIFEHIVEDDGTVSTDDLYQAVMDLGWFPTEAAVAEAVQMVDKDGSGEIDFDEFVMFMQYLRKTEGFTQAEIEEFQRLFNKFDIEGSGEIDTVETSKALRAFGYPTAIEVVADTVAEVDVDGSGEMDMSEFLKMFRIFRNREMAQLLKEFEKNAEKEKPPMGTVGVIPGAIPNFDLADVGVPADDENADDADAPKKPVIHQRAITRNDNNVGSRMKELRKLKVDKKKLPKIITDLGYTAPELIEKAMLVLEDVEAVSWEPFLAFFKTYRTYEIEEHNRRAGFSVSEVEDYEKIFNKYDKDGGGSLSYKEMMPLLREIGYAPKNLKEQEQLKKIISEIDEDESDEIDFREFLHLMRRFLDDTLAARVVKEKEMVSRANFAQDDVAGWRAVFVKFDLDKSGTFELDEGINILAAVGINLTQQSMRDQYESIYHSVDEDGNGVIDFGEFLLLIRRLVDLDFGGIATRMSPKDKEETAQDLKKQRRSERRRSQRQSICGNFDLANFEKKRSSITKN